MIPHRCLALVYAITLAPTAWAFAPLRVDINADERSDMRTVGWENWQPTVGDMRRKFGEVTVTLRAGAGKLSLAGNKRLLVYGVTLGADGAVVTADQTATLEIELQGLGAGTHTFLGFHNAMNGQEQTYSVSVGNRVLETVQVSTSPKHNDELGISFIQFEVSAQETVLIRIASTGNQVALNGFALDVTDPRRNAKRPVPDDHERHADGDQGTVHLSWTPAAASVKQIVHVAADRESAAALAKLDGSNSDANVFHAEVTGNNFTVPAIAQDSRLHYLWRVDSVDAQGNVTTGDIWHFRIRHLAFPTAEGYGRFALGGRGGRVLHVTSLDDAGPGTLREAIEATGPRTVVFDVSGLISLKSKLIFGGENEFLTVAGQTAPGKGICIRDYTFGGLGGRDTIVQHIRLRLGDRAGVTMDGMGLASCDHCIIDHCSISWTIDEAFSSRGAKNITFQRNLISEALNIAGHKKYSEGAAHGYAGSIGGDIGSFHHSLLAHNAGRNWSLAGSIDQNNRHAGRLDIRNMVVYNWKNRTTDGGARQVNFVNNYYKPGPASDVMTYLNPQFENPSFGPQQYYVAGNVVEGITEPEGPLGPFSGMNVRGSQEAPVTVAEPFFESYVKTQTAREAYENVLADVGCNVPRLDDHDQRVLRETRAGTATYRGSKSGLPGLPDTQADVGGWEEYPEIHRPSDWDSDGDGMPNHWEMEQGLNPDDAQDGTLDSNGDGYTNLESYLHWLTRSPNSKMEASTQSSP